MTIDSRISASVSAPTLIWLEASHRPSSGPKTWLAPQVNQMRAAETATQMAAYGQPAWETG
jgi:hypothetical protein